jgi:hypothetical protein
VSSSAGGYNPPILFNLMALSPGTRIGTFEVVALLGSGGMGEVYRARDTRLGREVALKILPDAFATDSARLARFTREAQTLAALNHPNIAHIHGLEESGGVRALVMELVEGDDLAQRLARGPIPLDETLPIAKQIAEALEAAHEQGIIHRDLKPANIKARGDGTVKVLDFGLAKAAQVATHASPDLANSPTLTSPAMMTGVGVILGTAAYMSPEQAKGRTADQRSDIWAFGCVLYEMLTGKRAFEGEDVSTALAKVIEREPDWRALPTTTAVPIRRLLRRCLEKDPKQRLQSIGDARLDINDALTAPSDEAASLASAVAPQSARKRKLHAVAAIAVVVALIGLAVLGTRWLTQPRPHAAPAVTRVTLTLPAEAPFSTSGPWTATNVAIAPAGLSVVYVGNTRDGSQLFTRSLDRFDIAAIAGSEGALNPFFSADGEWIGFFAGGKLKKVRLDGGPPTTICDASFGFGATWTDDGTIIFAGLLGGGLSRVSADGGQPRPFTHLGAGEQSHRWPAWVPASREVLFAVAPAVTSWAAAHIAIQSLDSDAHRSLLASGTAPRYAPTGHIVFARAGALYAVGLDRARWATVGSPIPVVQGVMMDSLGGRAQYGLSTTGTLVLLPGGAEDVHRNLIWVQRNGGIQTLPVQPRAFERPRISPNGRQVALTIRDDNADVWVLTLDRGTLTRITQESGEDESAVWSPDGKRVTYSSSRGAFRLTFWKNADGSGTEDQLFAPETHQHLVTWTPDGRFLLTDENEPSELFERSLDQKSVARPYLHTPFYKRGAQLSPEGHFIAYTTDESGRDEVYIQGSAGGRWQISAGGGAEPMWARSGHELFYRNGRKMLVVDVQTAATFRAGSPRVLFEGQYASVPWGEADYDVSPDDQRLLMIKAATALEPASTATPSSMVLVLNWFEELKTRVPTK